ncbi:MAG: hypothetical protein AAFO01_18495, partial [Pseudomonadota bacterium]
MVLDLIGHMPRDIGPTFSGQYDIVQMLIKTRDIFCQAQSEAVSRTMLKHHNAIGLSNDF